MQCEADIRELDAALEQERIRREEREKAWEIEARERGVSNAAITRITSLEHVCCVRALRWRYLLCLITVLLSGREGAGCCHFGVAIFAVQCG